MKPTIISCKVCGREFTATDPRKMYCSTKCNTTAQHRKHVPVSLTHKNCEQCGSDFKLFHKRDRFCSAKCKYTWGNAHKSYTHVCLGCGKAFSSRAQDADYCTRSCALRNTVVARKLICVDCGVEFNFTGRTRKRRCDSCNTRYWRAWARRYGTNSDGAYRRALCAKPTKTRYAFRATCYAYWPRRCAVCGVARKGYIDVHHVDGNPQNDALSNLVPLCRHCHKHVHSRVYRGDSPSLESSLFEVWKEGPKTIGIIAQQCAKANTANSENAKLETGLANAELDRKLSSVETIHGAPVTGEDIVQTTK